MKNIKKNNLVKNRNTRNWKYRRNYKENTYSPFSYSKILKKKRKINSDFEVMLSGLSLEEIIGLKLEISFRKIANKAYNLPLWSSMPFIAQEAVLRAAISIASSKSQAASILGMSPIELDKLIYFYGVKHKVKEEKKIREEEKKKIPKF